MQTLGSDVSRDGDVFGDREDAACAVCHVSVPPPPRSVSAARHKDKGHWSPHPCPPLGQVRLCHHVSLPPTQGTNGHGGCCPRAGRSRASTRSDCARRRLGATGAVPACRRAWHGQRSHSAGEETGSDKGSPWPGPQSRSWERTRPCCCPQETTSGRLWPFQETAMLLGPQRCMSMHRAQRGPRNEYGHP